MIQTDIFDLLNAVQLRDAGIESVMSHNETWADRAFIELEFFSRQRTHLYWKSEFTPTDIRTWLSACDVGQPDNCNAWGGYIKLCIKRKLIVDSGLPSRRTGAHARKQTVYKWSWQ